MGGDKKLETMSEELKLLKGELKQSLASVRDYLLNMELPNSEFSNILDALDGGEGQKVTMTGSLAAPSDRKLAGETREEVSEAQPEVPEEENLIEMEETPSGESASSTENSLIGDEKGRDYEEALLADDEPVVETGPEAPDKSDEVLMQEGEVPVDENHPLDLGNVPAEPVAGTPKVNMLANLITWIARAKKEIGYDRLPTLLEVYGISGHLSSELKEVIMQLAEIVGDKPEAASDTALWSQAMLSLHGILTGGDAPLHPVLPFMAGDETATEEETPEEEKPKQAPFKLKLVFPNGDGKDKEFCINLTPEEADNKGSTGKKTKK